MTPFDCSVHTHSTLCDGKSSPKEMVAAAYAAGVKYYGVSCHSHTPIPLDEGGVLPADMTAYRDTVLRLREQYAGKMEILLGLEWDSCADVEPEGFDYWIGSVHYQRAPDGSYYTTDWDDEKFLCCLNEGCGGDVMTLIERYYEEAARVAAKKPTILGHFDGIVKLNAGNKYFDEDSSRYRELALTALHSADPAASLLEINTGGMFKHYRRSPYPARFLLEEWRAMGGRIIITSDAHAASGILFGYQEAIDLAKAAGFTHSVLLTSNGPLESPL